MMCFEKPAQLRDGAGQGSQRRCHKVRGGRAVWGRGQHDDGRTEMDEVVRW